MVKTSVRGPSVPTSRSDAKVATPTASVAADEPMSVPPPLPTDTPTVRLPPPTPLPKRSVTRTTIGAGKGSVFSMIVGCDVTVSCAGSPGDTMMLGDVVFTWSAVNRSTRVPT